MPLPVCPRCDLHHIVDCLPPPALTRQFQCQKHRNNGAGLPAVAAISLVCSAGIELGEIGVDAAERRDADRLAQGLGRDPEVGRHLPFGNDDAARADRALPLRAHRLAPRELDPAGSEGASLALPTTER